MTVKVAGGDTGHGGGITATALSRGWCPHQPQNGTEFSFLSQLQEANHFFSE